MIFLTIVPEMISTVISNSKMPVTNQLANNCYNGFYLDFVASTEFQPSQVHGQQCYLYVADNLVAGS